MHRTVRGVITAVVVAGVVLGAFGVAEAKPKKQSTAKYAKTVCSTYVKLQTDFAAYAMGIANLDATDTGGFTVQAVSQTNTFLATVKADEQRLQAVYPDISNGKKVGTLLASKAVQFDATLSAALSQLQSGGPAGPAVFSAAIMPQVLDAKTGDPFSKLTDQGLINGLQREKSCKGVVHVIR
jgi:hypothetical protein